MAAPAVGSPGDGESASRGPAVDVSTLTIKQIFIVFDEGTNARPDNFGIAVLDNIDINGTLVGS